ncbi:MAG: DUF5694 domain-containing protein [Gemmatimonadota bacterium]|nr:DUF5694 domain-containing protein [Gemmatimonadota bacterium]
MLRIPSAVLLTLCTYLTAQGASGQAPGWPACGEAEVEVVLFGTFHMEGSSDDLERDVDNMLSERRQAEMPDVVSWLRGMAPDRIAVEVAWADRADLRESYQTFRNGEIEPSANEVQQLGFRTAAALGHEDVYAIDYRIGIGNDSISAFYERHPEIRARNSSIGIAVARSSRADDLLLAESTLLEYLRHENSEAALRNEGNRLMYAHLIAGEGTNYGGADLMSRWYERNVRMAHHIARITEPDDRRVLVIVGAGHIRPLRDVLDLSPHFCPRSPLDFEP